MQVIKQACIAQFMDDRVIAGYPRSKRHKIWMLVYLEFKDKHFVPLRDDLKLGLAY